MVFLGVADEDHRPTTSRATYGSYSIFLVEGRYRGMLRIS